MRDRERLTQRGTIINLRPPALIAQMIAAMADAHSPATAAADHEALQQRASLARSSAPLGGEVVEVVLQGRRFSRYWS